MAHAIPSAWQPGAWLSKAGVAVVSVFFPADCRLCGGLLTNARRVPICEDCLASFRPVPDTICDACGSPVEVASSENAVHGGSEGLDLAGDPACRVCKARTFCFDRARSYAAYDGKLVRAILLLKFERMEPLGAWFAQKLAEIARREPKIRAVDVIVPVPLHRQRERERGYNQAALMARPLARQFGLPYRAMLLVRTKPRPDKQLLSWEERWESVRGAFATRPGSQVDNLRVLLVDDVMTTGATLDACAKALREAGAKSVIGLTVARAVRHPIAGAEE